MIFFKGKDTGKPDSNAGRYLKMFSLRRFAALQKTVRKQQPTLGSFFLLSDPPLWITKGRIRTHSHLAVWGSWPTLSCDGGRRRAGTEHRNGADAADPDPATVAAIPDALKKMEKRARASKCRGTERGLASGARVHAAPEGRSACPHGHRAAGRPPAHRSGTTARDTLAR